MAREMNYEALEGNLRMIEKKGELAFEEAKANGTLTSEQEKFSALISDEAFLQKFFAVESAQEAVMLFKENGLEISEEEINAFGEHIVKTGKKLVENGGELTEEELEEIAGGFLGITRPETESEGVRGSLGAAGGFIGGGLAGGGIGYKVGAVIGTAICAGPGTAIGSIVGLVIGTFGGAIGGLSGGWKFGVNLPKIGKWIKSWF